MATPNPYFLYPFAIDSSSLLAVPNTGASTGAMSYEYGFTINYEQDLQSVSTALPIPRNQFNQLMLDITSAIQQLQLHGVPNWVASGSGGPASYPLYATVLYIDGNVYQSTIASNTATPGVDQSWIIVSGQANSVPIGTIIDFAGTSAPSGYILCDGSAVSRTVTYAQLFNAIVPTQSCTTINMNTTLTVVNAAQMYTGMYIEGVGIPAGTTIASITNNTTVVMSQQATASGTVTVSFFNWGNGDGSTTYNLPNLSGIVLAGADAAGYATSGILTQMAVGNEGGASSYSLQANDLPAHTHAPLPNNTAIVSYQLAGGSFGVGSGGGSNYNTASSTGNNTTTNNAVSLVQPTALTFKCIKYI